MRPRTLTDWIAFVPLLTGTCAWSASITDINMSDPKLEPNADLFRDVASMLIAAAGVYCAVRVAVVERHYRW